MSADPYWNYVKLLCHFDGPDGSTRVVDERHNPALLGSTLKLSSLQKKFGATSVYFTNDPTKELYWNASAVTSISGTLDLTLESWVFPLDNVVVNPWVWGFGNSSGMTSKGAALYADSAAAPGKFSFVLAAYHASTPLLVSTSTISYEGWVHVAVTRSNNIWRLFVNGVLEASATYAGATISATTFRVSNPAGQFVGYIDDLRLTVGVCRYTADFAPPTEAFPGSGATDQHYDKVVLHLPLTGENNTYTVVDLKGHPITADSTDTTLLPKIVTSTPALTMIGGSCLLISNGPSPHLTAISPDFNIGTADFCFEFFVGYYSYSTFDETLFGLRNGTDTGWAFRVTRNSNNAVTNVYINDVLVLTTSLTYPGYGAAQRHIAISRSGGVIRLFSAGTVSTSTYASAADLTGNGRIYIFGYPATASAGGYYNQVRYTIGDGRYTTDFTPPTDPFPEYALQKLTGTVFDAAGNPVAKTVRSYRTSDGLLIDQSVSDATTGAFELRATDTTEHFVVVHDATKNALVYDHIVPVI